MGALVVAAVTSGHRGREFDRRLYRAVNGRGGSSVDAFFKGITELGSIWAAVGAAAVIARDDRSRRAALDGLSAAWAMWALGQAIKKLYRRPRPYHAMDDARLLIAEPRGTSWPSSHPAVLLTFLKVCLADLDSSGTALAGGVGLAGAVALSRVYLGVHYPADVAGGLLLGKGLAELWGAAVSPRLVPRSAASGHG